jgi:protein-tyrosine phosphatase
LAVTVSLGAMSWPPERRRHGGVDRIPLPVTAGQLWLCGKHYIGPDPEDALRRIGADMVVCLNERHEIQHRYPDYVDWLKVHEPDRARWWPMPDLHAPPLGKAVLMVAELRALLAEDRRVLMHCGAGIGRAGTMAAALLIDMGSSLDDALQTVAASRPMAGPEAGSQRHLLEHLAAAS